MNSLDGWGLLLVEASILASLLFIILFVRRALRSVSPKRARMLSKSKKTFETHLGKINQLLKESETLSLDLSNNLEEKREIVKKLMDSLDEKIKSLEQLLEKVEGKIPAPDVGPNGQDGSGQIVEMALAGCGVADIAKRLGLSKEEVQLILDLRKITTHGV